MQTLKNFVNEQVFNIALLCAGLALPVVFIKIYYLDGYMDFDVYYRTAVRFKEGLWDQIYNSLADGNCPYRYSPVSLIWIRPLADLSLLQGRLLWFLIQYIFYVGGFFVLWPLFKKINGFKNAQFALGLCFLITIRFFLDSFMIGQISGFLFCLLCVCMRAICDDRPVIFGAALSIPSLLKIGPGIFYLSAVKSWQFFFRCLLASLGVFGLLNVLLLVSLHDVSIFMKLWGDWIQILVLDSVYFDASHYGSQSLKSALLRLAQAHVFSVHFVERVFLGLSGLIIGFMIFIWTRWQPKSIYTKALLFSLGVFPNLWLMPESFKYSFPILALPIGLLSLNKYANRKALYLSCLFFFVPSKDFFDLLAFIFQNPSLAELFFSVHRASIPFLGTCILFVLTVKHLAERLQQEGAREAN